MLKKISSIILIALMAVFISGCGLDKGTASDLPANSGQNKKPSSNEVKEIHGMMENIERLNLFVDNAQTGKDDKIRLTRYTIEGDPIFHDLAYHDSKLTVKIDTTEDKFGQGEISTYVCKGIRKHESETETKFILEECPDVTDLLTIFHDVDKEDYFSFELKYGVGKKNVINTKEQKLIKDLQNGETVAVSDFQFSKKEMNAIYKLMIFSNYLGEKKLSKECNQKPYEGYDMHVWINSGERHFEWSECDKSYDGQEMSELVANILEILKKNSTYQSLPEVKGQYE
ncbi:DUF4362 domain-containing protein [Neobacillus vireti]|uniref:DUF4362 domain-containing protein n=1 Tax=Neobacillus vireti LMG 21834 TaxID=1131730 RepID=A0AB94IUR8_9BACI|nr:DUF4362 domain-containing protein [Neobacillus vireti]ETI70757.1 hypothetical protein BAVI_00100 [Neobacillus vireti LMG 21834]